MKLNFKEIIEGWRNLINPPEELREVIDTVSKERMSICVACPFMSENAKNNGYKTFRMDQHCTKCGCPLAAKTKSLSSACPMNYWLALTDDENRYEIEKIIKNENSKVQEGAIGSSEESSGDLSKPTDVNSSESSTSGLS